ncbi:MAG: non-hydrolyzing UDP-N-acetylglucosamine 2-epimerase [Mariprofundus sp.]
MKRLKVMTIVGTRPEIIKLSRVIAELEQHTEHVLVHSGQNFDFELNEVFFRDLEIRKPDYFLEAVGESVAESIGLIITRADKVMEKEQPDAVLIYGDTNTGLAVISAKRRKIPVFHMEAGNRCFDQRVPEEINRKILDHLSDINMPLTEHARRYLLAEGIRPETIIKTGSSMQEVLNYCMPSILNSDVLSRLKLTENDYILVSAHREENVDSEVKLSDLLDSLNAVAKTYGKRVIVSTHPRTRLRLDVLADQGKFRMDQGIEFLKPFGFMDYIHLQIHAFCVLSDSGTITEEASILNFPAVMIREAHERPEGMDEGVLIMSGLKRKRILQAVSTVTAQAAGDERLFRKVPDYQMDNVSKKVVRTIISYVDYINRTVWHR